MSVYIVLGKFTQEGITKIKDSPQRLEASRKSVQSLGGEMKAFYYTMGQYDYVAIIEMPNNEAMMKGLLRGGSRGSVSTETLVAIPAEQAAEIIKEL